MLRNTLSALVQSGDTVLRRAGIATSQVTVRPLRSQQVMLPRLAFLRVQKGAVGRIYVGADGDLANDPATADQQSAQSAFGALCEDLLTELLASISAPRSAGTVQPLQAQNSTVITRGVRAYGIVFETDAGSLHVVAELSSRGEIEAAQNSDFERCLVNAAVPRAYRDNDELTAAGLSGALRCLSELESDIELEVATADDEIRVYTGLLWRQAGVEDGRLLQIVAAPPRDAAPSLSPGEIMTGHCTVGGRAYVFETEYAGPGRIDLGADSELPCLLIARPTQLSAEQRRQNFRIEPRTLMRAELSGMDLCETGSPPVAAGPDSGVRAEVADISFSGARLVAPLDKLRSWLEPGDCVRCRFHFPGRTGRLVVTGRVRRVTTVIADRAKWQDDVGLEFLVNDDDDRRGMESIRDYVLTEQRVLLSRRVQLPQH